MKLVDEKFKDMSAKQKLSYIWYYYKVPIVLLFVLMFIVTDFIHGRLTAKPTVFRLAMIGSNATELMEDTLMDGFYHYCPGFDPDKEQMILDAGFDLNDPGIGAYTAGTKLLAEYGAGNIDATIADKADITFLAESQAFADLTEILPEDLMTEIRSSSTEILYNKYEDPATGEVHEYPFAVNISGSRAIKQGFTESTGENKSYYNEDCYCAISPNSDNPENSIEFLRYLISE